MTTQAPHAIRTVLALVAGHVGLQEDKIRVISPDIGGGFGITYKDEKDLRPSELLPKIIEKLVLI